MDGSPVNPVEKLARTPMLELVIILFYCRLFSGVARGRGGPPRAAISRGR